LIWSIEYLINCVKKCAICNSDDSNKTESENDSSNQQTVDNLISEKLSNDDSEATNNNQTDKKLSKNKNTSSQKCSVCDDCNNLLEQSFNCLFGYKKPRSKYLENHSVINIKYTLENCVNLYKYFMLDECPEYDHKLSRSITVEVLNAFNIIKQYLIIIFFIKYHEFLLEVLKLINQNENKEDDLDWIAEKFIKGFQNENYEELSDLLETLKRDHLE
jgi:hypothetical protein